jgi:hypothetical protein
MTNERQSNNHRELPIADESQPPERTLTPQQRAFATVVGRAIAEAQLARCRGLDGHSDADKV